MSSFETKIPHPLGYYIVSFVLQNSLWITVDIELFNSDGKFIGGKYRNAINYKIYWDEFEDPILSNNIDKLLERFIKLKLFI